MPTLAALLLTLACAGQTLPSAQETEPMPATADLSEPATLRWLVLARHQGKSVQYAPVSLLGDAPVAQPLLEVGAQVRVDELSGPLLAWASPAGEDGWRLTIHPLEGGGGAEHALSVEPHALLLTGATVHVGFATGVGSLAPDGTWTVAHTLEQPMTKAYDHFAREGDRVVAVDDISMPFWATLFTLLPDGSLKHERDWRLPSIINGSYRYASLRGEHLAVAASYGIMSGSGWDLLVSPVGEELDLVHLNGGSSTSPVIEEHRSRARTLPSTLLVGTEHTAWTGLVHSGEHLAIGAGTRGLMVLPALAKRGDPARQILLDGPVLSVVPAEAGRLWLLVGGTSIQQVDLSSGEVVQRLDLEGEWERLVQ